MTEGVCKTRTLASMPILLYKDMLGTCNYLKMALSGHFLTNFETWLRYPGSPLPLPNIEVLV